MVLLNLYVNALVKWYNEGHKTAIFNQNACSKIKLNLLQVSYLPLKTGNSFSRSDKILGVCVCMLYGHVKWSDQDSSSEQF